MSFKYANFQYGKKMVPKLPKFSGVLNFSFRQTLPANLEKK